MNKKKVNAVSLYFSEIGSKGGKNTLKNKGKKHFSEIGKLGAKKRWKKLSTEID